MEESSQQRHIQKEEFKHNPEESAIVSFLGNDPQTNKKWIQYNSSQIRHGYYVSNGAIARGTVPETYQSTDSTQAVIDWKPYYPVPFPDIEESENNDELTTHCIFLVLKSTYTPLPIFLIKKNSFAADSIFLVKKNAVKKEAIFLIKKGSLKAAYVALLELQTEYVYIYNEELHSCDRVPISEMISGQKTYADYEQCKKDNLHCTGGPDGGGSGGGSGIDPSVLIADSIAANHKGWTFTFYFAVSSRVKDMVNPASIWYNGGIVWDISTTHSGGQGGEAIDIPPSTKTNTYAGGGSKYKSSIEYQRNTAMQVLPCNEENQEIATDNLREYTRNSGIYLSVTGGSKGSVVNAIKSRPLIDSKGGDGEYTCVDHGYFFPSFQMAPTGTATTSEVFPYVMTGYLAQISTSKYNKPGINKFFPGDTGGGGDTEGEYYYCGNPPIERKGIWLEYVLFFEGKQFNTGVSVNSKDVISSDYYNTYINTLNSHKFVIGVTSDEIFLRIWNKAIWRNINSGFFVYSLATTFLLNRSDLSVKSKIQQNAVTENVAIDYRFFHTSIQSMFHRQIDGVNFAIAVDIWSQAFTKINQNIIDVPYNFTYGYYSGNLIKGTMDNSVVSNPDVILDVFFINPNQLINGKTWKEHIIKSNQDAANVNIVVTVTKYRRIQVSSGQFFSIKQTRTEKIVNLMRGLGISDNEQYNIARIAGVVVYV